MRIGLLLFITIPMLEMYLLILVGGHIGALPTIGLVVLTATLGMWLLRLEGFATLQSVQTKLNHGEIPGRELLEGVMLLIGGALLLTPGFVTDGIGFVCLLPGLRKPIAQWLIGRGMLSMTQGFTVHQSGGFQQFGGGQFHAHANDGKSDGRTFDGEFKDETPGPHRSNNSLDNPSSADTHGTRTRDSDNNPTKN